MYPPDAIAGFCRPAAVRDAPLRALEPHIRRTRPPEPRRSSYGQLRLPLPTFGGVAPYLRDRRARTPTARAPGLPRAYDLPTCRAHEIRAHCAISVASLPRPTATSPPTPPESAHADHTAARAP